MIELFDTHAHFEGTREETCAAVERARAAGVTRIMAVGGSETLNAGTEGFEHRAIGWDRDQAGKELPDLDYTGVAAVGEIGLDYHYSPETRAAQMELFAEADDDTLALLREVPSKGIIHCFTGNPAFCRALLDLGFYVSISGIVTFRAAANVRESALVVPDDRILVETDSPFLAPVPLRGNPNEPAFVVHTAKFLADLRSTPFEDFAALTTRNAMSLLGCARIAAEGRHVV